MFRPIFMSSHPQESVDLLENTLEWSHILHKVVGLQRSTLEAETADNSSYP